MPVNPLETYLRSLQDIRSSGASTDETAYYGSLEALLNEVGKTLKPKVRCFMGMKNLGSGMPDGGLFTADQYQKAADIAPRKGQTPARGAIEAKPAADDVGKDGRLTRLVS